MSETLSCVQVLLTVKCLLARRRSSNMQEQTINQHSIHLTSKPPHVEVCAEPFFAIYHNDFLNILGPSPYLCMELETNEPFAHEASVFIPKAESLFVTSNLLKSGPGASPTIKISRLRRSVQGHWYITEVPSHNVPMANGGVNYKTGILFCAQGSTADPGGLVLMEPEPPYATRTLLSSFHGRPFNSVNDVVVHSDGSIWFTDPTYGFEQGYRFRPQLPSQVYRFHPEDGSVRAMADGFGHPNGIAFSPDERTVYVTDTDFIHGDGSTDLRRASHIYAFDLVYYHSSPFLINRRLFAMADVGVPDGIKCDLDGNVYSGCGDGLSVWNAGGVLLGKIIVPGGVANFCFGRPGELFLLNETKFWTVQIAQHIKGALLHGMGIDT